MVVFGWKFDEKRAGAPVNPNSSAAEVGFDLLQRCRLKKPIHRNSE
jgi:hypothetical protein